MATQGDLVDGFARTRHPLFWTWYGMLSRCENPDHVGYAYYGGRGVAVCERWHDFAAFVKDVGSKPSEQHSIDRFPDKEGSYAPGNWRWATKVEQIANRTIVPRLPPLVVDSSGTRLLRGWVTSSGLTVTAFANLVGVAILSARPWLTGDTRPANHCRVAIERICGIDASIWMTDDEYVIAYGVARESVAS